MQLSGIVKHYLRTSTNFTSITDAAHQYRVPCNSSLKRHVLWIRSFPKRALLYLRYVTEKETTSVSLNDKLQCDNLYENKHTCKKPHRYKYAFVIRPPCLSILVFEVDIHYFLQNHRPEGNTSPVQLMCPKSTMYSSCWTSQKCSFSCIYKLTDN